MLRSRFVTLYCILNASCLVIEFPVLFYFTALLMAHFPSLQSGFSKWLNFLVMVLRYIMAVSLYNINISVLDQNYATAGDIQTVLGV